MSRPLPPALILAAGESSRFWPLSTHGHKCLHRLAGRSIIEYTVRSLIDAGVRDIVVVQSPIARAAHFPHRTVADQLGDGSELGVRLRYVEQPEPAGQGNAILLAQDLLDGDFVVVQPENLNAGEIVRELVAGRKDGQGAVAAQERAETWLFGVFEHQDGTVRRIVEKPEPGREPSKLCNMGVYLVGQSYLELLRREPDDLLSNLAALQKLSAAEGLSLVETRQPFFPLKYPWHLFAMRDHLAPEGWADDSATVQGANIEGASVIERDAFIAPGVTISDTLVGAGSRIESDLKDCIIGAGVSIGPDVKIDHTKLDGGRVSVDVKGHAIDTQLDSLGTVIGQGSQVGPGASIAAGVLIGAEAKIAPKSEAKQNVDDRAETA